MAKRAPILPENYNPVGERLKRFLQPPGIVEPPASPPKQNLIDLPRRVVETERPATEPPGLLPERELIPEIPTDRELKSVSVRFRCTLGERKKWHEITRELSGDHSNLSHFIRSAMLLVENAYDQLQRLAPDIRRLQKPATTDALGITLYEQRLSQHLYDAIKSAGRPKG